MHLTKERLMKKVARTPGGCWEWTGTRYWTGYGLVIADKVRYAAHRASYMVHVGTIPEGKVVCHKCDNPACINPEHLFLGSKADNSADMVSKNRSALGERNAKAKLTEAQAREVLSLRGTGESLRKVAQQFGVTAKAIHFIWQGVRWKHLQGGQSCTS